MLKNKIQFVIVLLLICAFRQVQAQQSMIYTDLYKDYKKGMELFENQMYSTAQELFNAVGAIKPTEK